MYKSLNSWIEYLHPKLGYPIIAKIEDEKKIRLQGNKIIKKVVNMECVYSEAWQPLFFSVFICFNSVKNNSLNWL